MHSMCGGLLHILHNNKHSLSIKLLLTFYLYLNIHGNEEHHHHFLTSSDLVTIRDIHLIGIEYAIIIQNSQRLKLSNSKHCVKFLF